MIVIIITTGDIITGVVEDTNTTNTDTIDMSLQDIKTTLQQRGSHKRANVQILAEIPGDKK